MSCERDRLFVAVQCIYPEVAAQHRQYKSAVRKLDGGALVCVSNGGDDVTSAGEVLGQEGIVGQRPGVAMSKQHKRMRARDYRRVLHAVRADRGQINTCKLRDIAPDFW